MNSDLVRLFEFSDELGWHGRLYLLQCALVLAILLRAIRTLPIDCREQLGKDAEFEATGGDTMSRMTGSVCIYRCKFPQMVTLHFFHVLNAVNGFMTD